MPAARWMVGRLSTNSLLACKALELFNLQRAAVTGARTVIVVEDYLSCKVPNQYHCEYDDHESNYCSYVVD
jgi:hypothetical protein